MNKTMWLAFSMTLVIASASDAWAQNISAETIKADVAAAGPVRLSAVVQEFRGSLSTKNITAQLDSAISEIIRQKADFSFEGRGPVGVLVLYEDPTGKDNVRGAIGLAVGTKLEVKGPLKLEQFAFKTAVRNLHTGPPDRLDRVYRQIEEAVKASGKGSASFPVVLQILDDPNRVKPELVRTLLSVPIK